MLAMAAALATLEAIEQDAMIENAREIERVLRERTRDLRNVVAIHGKGCLLGIEFTTPASDVHRMLLERKIITGTSSDPKILRLLPPLCTTTAQIGELVDCLAEDALGAAS
jgi:4-aminobutyrate aminotransferase-like enzyme